jgi:hypothetical protein
MHQDGFPPKAGDILMLSKTGYDIILSNPGGI